MAFSVKKQAAQCWIYITPRLRCSRAAVPRGVFCAEHGAAMVEWLEADERIGRAARKGEASERRASAAWLRVASPAAKELMADDGLWDAFEEKRLCSIPVAPGIPCAGQRAPGKPVCAEHLAAHRELQGAKTGELSPAAREILADMESRPEAYGRPSRRGSAHKVVDLRDGVASEERTLHAVQKSGR